MVSFVWQAAGLAVMLAMPNSVVALHVGSIIVGERELCRFSLPVHWPATGEFLDHPLRSAGVREPVSVTERG